MAVCAPGRFAEAEFALNLDMIEPARRREALDLGALGVGGAIAAVVF